ncbi:testis-expressed protein 11-like [Clavelina lepadiformis]|uniref:testis-expressed protein 11-like n=1 Tax=Clavelina lepadiformis TaxID=159417 RepID=UPI004041961A
MECLQAEDKEPDEYKRERDRISALAYNFGLNASIKHKHDDSIKWLNFSYEFSKKRKAADLKLMAQTLRLLAHVYYETGVPENMAKALGTLEIANSHFCHPAGLHLRLKVMSKDNGAKDDQLKSALLELLRHKELTIDLGLSACRFLNTYKRYEACELGLKELLSRFTGSRHVGRVHAQRHQAAIERLPVQDALDFSDKFLDDQEVLTSFDDESCKVIQLSLWEQAAKCHDAGEMDHCMRWYDQSLRLFLYGKSLDEVKSDRQACDNVAKLQRNRASCLLSLARFAEAEEAARAAVEFDNDSLLSSFTLFKVAIAKCDENEAVEAVKNLTSKKDMDCSTAPFSGKKVSTRHALICLAAQLALERSQRQVAMVTLRYLATTGDQNYSKLVAYRCLIRLYLTMAEEVEGDETTSSFVNAIDGKTTNADPAAHSNEVEPMETESENINWKSRFCLMTAAIKSAFESYEVLKHIKLSLKPNDAHQLDKGLVLPGNENHVINDEEYDKEVTWFMKIAWNMALQFNQNPVTMKRLFMLCQDLLNLSESNEGVLLRQKTCLLMCAACGLAIARNAASFDDSRKELNAVLDITARCQKVCDKLAGLEEAQTPQKEDKSSVLLALYRFEALAKLTKPNQKGVSENVNFYFDEITRFRLADFKTYETLAALSIEPPARHSDVCKKALKMALKEINRKLAQESNNADKTPLLKKKSSLYRKLIDVALGEGSSSDPSSKEEAWMYFNEVLQAMQSDVWKYPDMDALWTTIRCWNTGIHLFVADHVIEAEKWCALALRMLAQVERFKGSYENHMNIVYQEILSKKDYAVVRQPSSNFAL